MLNQLSPFKLTPFKRGNRAGSPSDLLPALDAFCERLLKPTLIDLRILGDEGFGRVESGCPEGWQELWDQFEEDPTQETRFEKFAELIDSNHKAERWLTGAGKGRRS